MDAETARLAADGGADFRRGVYRAADSEAIDSFDQIDNAVRKIENLDGPANHRAKLLVYDTDGPGVKLVDELDSTDLRTLFKSVESRDTLARLSRQFDDGTVESRHLDEITDLLDSGDMDSADLGRFSEMLDQRKSDPLIDDSIGADDLLATASKSDLSDSLGVIKRGERIHTIPEGDVEAGWNHIKSRHIDGDYKLDQKDSTSFFPAGQTVKGKELPDGLSERKVQEMVADAIKHGDETVTGSRIEYYFEPTDGYSNSGVNNMKVIVDDGTVKTAFPISGEKVYKWVPDLNDGNGVLSHHD